MVEENNTAYYASLKLFTLFPKPSRKHFKKGQVSVVGSLTGSQCFQN
jgi:hypothetical protein